MVKTSSAIDCNAGLSPSLVVKDFATVFTESCTLAAGCVRCKVQQYFERETPEEIKQSLLELESVPTILGDN